MDSRTLVGVYELDGDIVLVGGYLGDLHGLALANLKPPCLGTDVPCRRRAVGKANGDVLVGVLEAQAVVPGREVVDHDETVADAQRLEPVSRERPVADFQQRQFASQGLVGLGGVGDDELLPGLALQGARHVVGVPHGLPGPVGPRGGSHPLISRKNAVDISQLAQVDPPGGVGLQRDVNLLREVAMLERQIHGPIRQRLAVSASHLDSILAVGVKKVQVIHSLRGIYAVKRKRLPGGECLFLVLADVLDLRGKLEADRY